MLSYDQVTAMDTAVHDMSGSCQGLVTATYGVRFATPEDEAKMRKAVSEAVRGFSAAKDAYRLAKEGSCEAVFRAPAVDANGAEVVEEVA